MTFLSQPLSNTISHSCDRGWIPTTAQRGAIGYFLILFITIVLLTAMGLFFSVRKGSEHSVFSRFHTGARLANQGAILDARLGIDTLWDPTAAPTTYSVHVDTQNVTTVTIDSIGMP